MNYDDIWPRQHITRDDIDGPKRLIISEVRLKTFYSKFTKSEETKPVVRFTTAKGRQVGRFLTLGKTTWRQIEEIAGSDDSDDWAGVELVLYRSEKRPHLQIRPPGSNNGNGHAGAET